MSSKIYSAVFYPLSLATIVSSVFPLCCSAIPRNATGHGRGEGWYLWIQEQGGASPFPLIPQIFYWI